MTKLCRIIDEEIIEIDESIEDLEEYDIDDENEILTSVQQEKSRKVYNED